MFVLSSFYQTFQKTLVFITLRGEIKTRIATKYRFPKGTIQLIFKENMKNNDTKVYASNTAVAPATEEAANNAVGLLRLKPEQNIDVASLQYHEQELRATASSIFRFASHLYSIREGELWAKSECTSFKQYCQERIPKVLGIKFSLRRLYQLAEWAEVYIDLKQLPGVAELNNCSNDSPAINEGQARALAKAPKAQRATIYQTVVKQGKPTAKKIAGIVAKEAEPVDADYRELDEIGDEIPPAILQEWNRAKDTGEKLKEHLRAVFNTLKNGFANSDSIFAELRKDEDEAVTSMVNRIASIIPHAVCIECKGQYHPRECKSCMSRGFISKRLYEKTLRTIREDKFTITE